MRGSHVWIVFGLLATLLLPHVAHACTGNCNGDGQVTIDEIIVGVNMALGLLPLTVCPIFDRDGSGAIEIDELIAAIDSSQRGCPITPASGTASPTTTALATPTASPTLPQPTPNATATATSKSSAQGQIEGQFQVVSDFFGDGPGERQTVLGDCNGDGLLDAVRLQWTEHDPPKLYIQEEPFKFVAAELDEQCPPIPGFADGR